MPYKGYGFIKGDDDVQVFVYNGSLVGGTNLTVGEKVTYDLGQPQKSKDGKEGACPAVNVSGPGVHNNSKGALKGRVKEWLAPRSCGFLITPDEKVYYVHHSAFNGAKLQNDEEVFFDELPDRVHKTGRGVAVNVTGPGVKERASSKGTVRRWSFEKRYGFVMDAETKQDIFIHANEIGGAALTVNKDLWYEIGTRDGKRFASNISGPAITDVKVFLGYQQNGYQQNGYTQNGYQQQKGGKGKGKGKGKGQKGGAPNGNKGAN